MVWKENEGIDPATSDYEDNWWKSLLDSANQYSEKKEDLGNNGGFDNSEQVIDWEYIEQCFRTDQILGVKVFGYNKGGLLVEAEKFRGFVPNSHISEISRIQTPDKRIEALKQYMHTDLSVKVIECDKVNGKLILSERAAESEAGRRLLVFDDLEIGSEIIGEVTNITKFGAFLDLGGIEGLVHVSEISWGKVHNPSNVVTIGDRINTKVISIDKEKMRIALSIKQLLPNPWLEFVEKFFEGDIVTVKITKVVGYGVFAEVENGIEGLVHASDIQSQDSGISLDTLKVGDNIIVTIKAIDVENRRLSMGFINIAE